MPRGPGIYDEPCTIIRHVLKAASVCLIVIGGSGGNGCSIVGAPGLKQRIPAMLRAVADELEKENQQEAAEG